MTDTIPEAVIEAMCAGGSMYGHPLPLPRARIAGALQAAQALGWKLVPVEPTEAMVEAADNCDGHTVYDYPACGETHWAAMIAASPEVG